MNARELKMDDRRLLAERDRQLAAKRASRARTAPRRKAGDEKKRIEEERDASFYDQAKRTAFARAGKGQMNGPRCEVVSIIDDQCVRCPGDGIDPDHVLGGAMKAECERLGAEGLQIMCRHHHDLKTVNSPSRGFWLNLAESHAKFYGYRRLLSLIARARAKYEAKHPARASSVRRAEGGR